MAAIVPNEELMKDAGSEYCLAGVAHRDRV
ncbi:MAG: hypothetical protein K0S78_1777 [Thermomicrobiales bacterium]|jgi:hypothetical protein|nr:hypothetical protein [Thermomicrobiales bacterium]MDF3041642.1 hypothetical protein [Thermomicrobiales bacterium]